MEQDQELGEDAAGNTGGQNWCDCLWHWWTKYWKWRGIWIRTREDYHCQLLWWYFLTILPRVHFPTKHEKKYLPNRRHVDRLNRRCLEKSERGSAIKLSRIFNIFWCPPPSSASGGGRLSQGRKSKFVTSLAFRRATSPGGKKQAQNRLKA